MFFIWLLSYVVWANDECTRVFAQFASDELITGESEVSSSRSTGEQGYSITDDFLSGREIIICPLPANITLKSHGMQVMNVKPALENEGITETTIDLEEKMHRFTVGRVLLNEIGASLGMRTFHLADTSRVDGGAEYGEATVRNTSSRILRKAHHTFHIDKLLSGICKLYQCSSNREAAKMIMDEYKHIWIDDMKREKVDPSLVEDAFFEGTAINAWVSLTSGHIEQEPLALVDPTSIKVSHEAFYTMHVEMPGLVDTISLLKFEESMTARFFWVPKMKFGDLLIFSTISTPHSAVRVLNDSEKPRQSAELRMVLLEDEQDVKHEL